MQRRYRVEITRTAERDVLGIHDYIEQESPERAAKWFVEMERQMRMLSQFPKRCPIIPERDDVGLDYRHLLWGNYRTIFRIEGKTVWIVRVIHGAQLLDTSTLESSLNKQDE